MQLFNLGDLRSPSLLKFFAGRLSSENNLVAKFLGHKIFF